MGVLVIDPLGLSVVTSPVPRHVRINFIGCIPPAVHQLKIFRKKYEHHSTIPRQYETKKLKLKLKLTVMVHGAREPRE